MATKRTYLCPGCGHFLFRTDVPLGTLGSIDLPCRNRWCKRADSVQLAEEQRVTVAMKRRWAALREQRKRARATPEPVALAG